MRSAPAEPYRRKPAFVHRRLRLALADAEGGNADSAALRAELQQITASVDAQGYFNFDEGRADRRQRA